MVAECIIAAQHGGISDNETFNFSGSDDPFDVYTYDLGSTTWKTGIVHDGSLTLNCIETVPSGSDIIRFKIGSEATRPSNPDYEHEWDNVELDYTDIVAADVSSLYVVEEGTGYAVEDCGSGNEPYQHTKTGKGTSSC